MTDTRDDGITYEMNKYRNMKYMQRVYPRKDMDVFLTVGEHLIRIDYGYEMSGFKVEQDEFLKRLLETEFDKGTLWEIQVSGRGLSVEGNWTLVAALIAHLPRVTVIRWDAEKVIPISIMDALHTHHPTCRLYYKFPNGDFKRRSNCRTYRRENGVSFETCKKTAQARDILEVYNPIIGSPVLYSFDIMIYSDQPNARAQMEFLDNVLTKSPNIRELESSTIPLRRRSPHPNDPSAFGFSNGTKRLPPLEVLKLTGYDLEGKVDGDGWMESETEQPCPSILRFPWDLLPESIVRRIGYSTIYYLGGVETRSKFDTSDLKTEERTNLDAWLDAMDWTHLHTLRLESFHSRSLRKLQGDVLPNLRNLELLGNPQDDASIYLDFLNVSAPLESLALTGSSFQSTESVLDIIETRHSPHLKKLHLNSPRHHSQCYQTDFFTPSSLSRLAKACPGLHTLDIDIETGTSWDYGLLDSITSFSELQYLTLRFTIPPAGTVSEEYESAYYFRADRDGSRVEDALMRGLVLYLKKGKVGRSFGVVRVYVGGREVITIRDGEDLNDFGFGYEEDEEPLYRYDDGLDEGDSWFDPGEEEDEEELSRLQRVLEL